MSCRTLSHVFGVGAFCRIFSAKIRQIICLSVWVSLLTEWSGVTGSGWLGSTGKEPSAEPGASGGMNTQSHWILFWLWSRVIYQEEESLEFIYLENLVKKVDLSSCYLPIAQCKMTVLHSDFHLLFTWLPIFGLSGNQVLPRWQCLNPHPYCASHTALQEPL